MPTTPFGSRSRVLATLNATSVCMALLFAASMTPRLTVAAEPALPARELFVWERGIGVRPRDIPEMAVYYWVYEWNMFEAMKAGQHTPGTYPLPREVNADGTTGKITSPELSLAMQATEDGATLEMTVTNRTDRAWPELASVIPCFNPGPEERRNPQFANTNTYFFGPEGLVRSHLREIHFNEAVRAAVDREAVDGKYVWTEKWPLSEVNAKSGLIIRESTNGGWVAGIAWERFLSAQAHNPWECMHLSVRVGPLAPGESRTVRGRIYIFEGDKEACLRRMSNDLKLGIDGPK